MNVSDLRVAPGVRSRHTQLVRFNVDLEDDTARRLDAIAEASGESRNAVVRRAVAEWLERRRAGWPAVVLEYRGDASLRAFESYRDE